MCNKLSISPTPTSEHLLCKFVTYLALNKISFNTIKVYLSGVHQLHIQEGLSSLPTADVAMLAQVLRGIRVSQATTQPHSRQSQYMLITPKTLQQVKAHQQEDLPSQDRIMLWVAFLTCFFGFFTSREICVEHSESFDLSMDLSVGNMRVDNLHNPRIIQIWLLKSKTKGGGSDQYALN